MDHWAAAGGLSARTGDCELVCRFACIVSPVFPRSVVAFIPFECAVLAGVISEDAHSDWRSDDKFSASESRYTDERLQLCISFIGEGDGEDEGVKSGCTSNSFTLALCMGF